MNTRCSTTRPRSGPSNRRRTGRRRSYEVLPPAEDKGYKAAGEWNQSRILVEGNHVEHWLNGKKALEYDLGSDEVKAAVAAGKFKKFPDFGQKIKGHIMLTDHEDEAWFRNIKIRRIPEFGP